MVKKLQQLKRREFLSAAVGAVVAAQNGCSKKEEPQGCANASEGGNTTNGSIDCDPVEINSTQTDNETSEVTG